MTAAVKNRIDELANSLQPLRVAKITTLPAANTYLRERFIPDYNATFSCAPANPASAFVPLGKVDFEQILCHQMRSPTCVTPRL